VFAVQDLDASIGGQYCKKAALILLYGGTLKVDDGAFSAYAFDLTCTRGHLILDALEEPRCIAAYLNDPRGTGLEANVGVIELSCSGGCLNRQGATTGFGPHPHIGVYLLRTICAGEELLLDYGNSYFNSNGSIKGVQKSAAHDADKVLQQALALEQEAVTALKEASAAVSRAKEQVAVQQVVNLYNALSDDGRLEFERKKRRTVFSSSSGL
jgi:hypothetical protein